MKNFNKLILACAVSVLAIDDQYSYAKGNKIFTNISSYQIKRFLDKDWDENKTLEDIIKNKKIDWKTGWLCADDVLLEKPYAEKIEGVYWLYSSKKNGFEQGINVTVLAWTDGNQMIPIRFMVYEKDNAGKALKTKNKFIEEAVKYANDLGIKPMFICFDSKYPSNDLLNTLQEMKWIYYAQLPSNRVFNSEQLKKRKFHLIPESGKMNGVRHNVNVIKHCKRYYVTNVESATGNKVSRQEILRNYKVRWPIEDLFRALKQLCHIKECKSRSLSIQRRYIMVSLYSFMLLQDQNQSSVYEAKIHFQRKFLGRKLNGDKALRQLIA
jgi:hypothetical protein